ncbi:hypothetical protein AB6D20_027755 (plasmid) [Vibrio splendidus]
MAIRGYGDGTISGTISKFKIDKFKIDGHALLAMRCSNNPNNRLRWFEVQHLLQHLLIDGTN